MLVRIGSILIAVFVFDLDVLQFMKHGVAQTIRLDRYVRVSEGIQTGRSVHHYVFDASANEFHRSRGKVDLDGHFLWSVSSSTSDGLQVLFLFVRPLGVPRDFPTGDVRFLLTADSRVPIDRLAEI